MGTVVAGHGISLIPTTLLGSESLSPWLHLHLYSQLTHLPPELLYLNSRNLLPPPPRGGGPLQSPPRYSEGCLPVLPKAKHRSLWWRLRWNVIALHWSNHKLQPILSMWCKAGVLGAEVWGPPAHPYPTRLTMHPMWPCSSSPPPCPSLWTSSSQLPSPRLNRYPPPLPPGHSYPAPPPPSFAQHLLCLRPQEKF